MSGPVRNDTTRASEGSDLVDRDTKIEDLLLAGLDRYFSGDYEQAINLWTRVAFLDRAHPRARAYIERARRALAERQRETDELLHRGVEAFNQGDAATARTLLTSAVARGAPQDVALAFLERLDRLEGVTTSQPRAKDLSSPDESPAVAAAVPASGPAAAKPPVRTIPLLIVTGLAIAVVVMAASSDLLGPLLQTDWQWRAVSPPATAPHDDPLPVPRPAELWLAKSKALVATGHLREALRALQPVAASDPLAPEADRLRAALQRSLLSGRAASDLRVSGNATPLGAAEAPESARE